MAKRLPTREQDLEQALRQAARLLGYKVYHTWSSLHSPAGFPDLVICGHGHLLFLECKSRRGQLTLAQREWLKALAQVTPHTGQVQAQVARPLDLDHIIEQLRVWKQEGTSTP